jgi:hypothetical protein
MKTRQNQSSIHKPPYLSAFLYVVAVPTLLYMTGLINFSLLDIFDWVFLLNVKESTLPAASQEAVSRVAGAYSWLYVSLGSGIMATKYLDIQVNKEYKLTLGYPQ